MERRRSIRSGAYVLIAALSAAIAMLAPAAPARAAGITTAYPEFVAPTYKGWTYVSANTAAPAWSWSAQGWLSASFPSGATMYAYPFSGVWSWGYANGRWYAIHTKYLARWSCVGPRDSATLTARSNAYRYNTSQSIIRGALAAGTKVELVCENVFADASIAKGTVFITAPEGYALIYATPRTPCLVPELPDGPVCKIMELPRAPEYVFVPAKLLEL